MDDRSWQTWLTLFDRLGRIETAIEDTRRDMPGLSDKVSALTESTDSLGRKMDLIILWGRRVPYILALAALAIANLTPDQIREIFKVLFLKVLG